MSVTAATKPARTVRSRTTFVVASMAWFAFALDKLVVATALPNIRTDLTASTSDLEWTVGAFTLTFGVLLLTGSALGDRFGRRRMFVLGMSLFTAASALAALSPTMPLLVAARALQGAGGALFAPVILTMLSLATPVERRGAVFGAWGGVGAVGAAIGPLVGGLLTQTVGWRSAFWINVPLGVVLVPLAWRRLAESHGPARRLDVPGLLLGTAGLLGVVWGVIRGGESGWLTPEVVLSLSSGAVLLIGFVRWELRAIDPLLPMRFFTNRTFAVAGLASFSMYAALFGSLFFVTQIFQTGLGRVTPRGGPADHARRGHADTALAGSRVPLRPLGRAPPADSRARLPLSGARWVCAGRRNHRALHPDLALTARHGGRRGTVLRPDHGRDPECRAPRR